MKIPSPSQFETGYLTFQRHEGRDSMYKTATFLVEHFWGKSQEMADSLGVLLLTWNQALYRYGIFDFDKLETCISNNMNLLNRFRKENILNYSTGDDASIEHLFEEFRDALQIRGGKKKGVKSPVAVAKALHLLAPEYFPLWDYRIAKAYGYNYSHNPQEKYLLLLRAAKVLVEKLRPHVKAQALKNKTLLKLLDEYNYAKYTKGWV